MKILVLILTLVFTLNAAKIDEFARETSYYRDYNLALARAQKEKKILMLVLVADFCPWCKKFERKTLKHEDIKKSVKKNLIPVIVDNYRDTNSFPKRFFSHALPTIYFINPDTQKVLVTSSLYVKKSEFNESMKKALIKFKENKND